MKEQDIHKRIDRRTLNRRIFQGISAVTLLAAAGTWIASKHNELPQSPLEEPTLPSPLEKPPYSEEAVIQRVFDILHTVPHGDENISKVYTGGEVSYLQYNIQNTILDFYSLPCEITTGDTEKVCDVQISLDSTVKDALHDPFIYSTVGLSEDWYTMVTPEAQFMTLEYAANTILQTPRFNRYQHRLNIAETTPPVVPNPFLEPIYMARHGVELLQTEPYNTIHKSAPLIQVLQRYESIDPEDIDLRRDIDRIVSPEFRKFIHEKGIPLHDLPTVPIEYDEYVFGLESPWVQAVMEWNDV